MSSPFLCGMVAAWAIAKVAVGAFFIVTHAYRRREREYLLFGLLCFAMAANSGGVALAYHVESFADWEFTSRFGHAGAICSAALNTHFVFLYNRLKLRPWVWAVDSVALGYLALNLSGYWYEPESYRVLYSNFFGQKIAHFVATPGLIATTFYTLSGLLIAISFSIFLRTYRKGQREIAWILVGLVAVILGAINDTLLATGIWSSIYLMPHGFLAYVFCIAITLPARYRSTDQELKATTSDLVQATKELRNSYVELQVVQDQLSGKEQLAQVGELAAAIAHEVRNPLAIIVNASASLRRSELPDADRATLLNIVEEEVARLNRLVTDLLQFAKPVKVSCSPVQLTKLLKQVGDKLPGGYQLKVKLDEAAEVQLLWADAGLLPLVIDNLVSNACQAMRDGGVINISAELVKRPNKDGVVRVVIADIGHGMDEVVRRRAATPFFTTRPSGTGLGLPIVERIVKAHGGRFEMESTPGVGTRVTLYLPVEKSGEGAEAFPPHLKRLMETVHSKTQGG